MEAIENMLVDFSKNNTDSVNGLGKYLKNGLPSNDYINSVLNELYDGAVQIAPTQVILWYKVPYEVDGEMNRHYKISDENNTELFDGNVTVQECTHHIDGLIVDISTLGGYIPEGTTIPVKNTATLGKLYDDATVDIIYRSTQLTNNNKATTSFVENTTNIVIQEQQEETTDTIDTELKDTANAVLEEQKEVANTEVVETKDATNVVLEESEKLTETKQIQKAQENEEVTVQEKGEKAITPSEDIVSTNNSNNNKEEFADIVNENLTESETKTIDELEVEEASKPNNESEIKVKNVEPLSNNTDLVDDFSEKAQ